MMVVVRVCLSFGPSHRSTWDTTDPKRYVMGLIEELISSCVHPFRIPASTSPVNTLLTNININSIDISIITCAICGLKVRPSLCIIRRRWQGRTMGRSRKGLAYLDY